MSLQVLHIAGWSACGFYRRAANVLASLSVLFPSQLQVIEHEFPNREQYRAWLIEGKFRDGVADERAHGHTSSPFTWIGKSEDVEGLKRLKQTPDVEDVGSFIGGHDDTLAYCRKLLKPCTGDDAATATASPMVEDGHTKDHTYDYDLIVIGGGSGGLACSKEAAQLGAKVAVLDYVKPSPAGTTWGLGGTCVNVGCIPKKLMHNAATLHASIQADASAFGILPKDPPNDSANNNNNDDPYAAFMSMPPPIQIKHQWDIMRENIQNHIKGLNFKYRVTLREKNVTYLNKLGTFIDKHTLQLTDKKGKVSTLTASRFVIAVGGRPSPLPCPGAELAISSDDLFSLDRNPGKVLCVGASYVSLECAGFLGALGHDVTVAVRSILLRGFDQECAEKIGAFMEAEGIAFKKKVTPTKLERVNDDNDESSPQKIKVTFSDGSSDEYDTVIAAIGRYGDTAQLGLDTVHIATNKNGKIPAKFEQTTCPNIYVLGDVMEGVEELTPLAIQAGLFLARRLFGTTLAQKKKVMEYKKICTTVFTPIEFGTVGWTEEEAIQTFGEKNVEVYHKTFTPLEWSISSGRGEQRAFTKVIVDRTNDQILGLHYVGPNAGEVTQGFGVAMKQCMTFTNLIETVGIHPTAAEEIVTLEITKRSGKDATQGSC